MFLSRVEIPWEFASNPYNLHRQLWRLFPGEDKDNIKRERWIFMNFWISN